MTQIQVKPKKATEAEVQATLPLRIASMREHIKYLETLVPNEYNKARIAQWKAWVEAKGKPAPLSLESKPKKKTKKTVEVEVEE